MKRPNLIWTFCVTLLLYNNVISVNSQMDMDDDPSALDEVYEEMSEHADDSHMHVEYPDFTDPEEGFVESVDEYTGSVTEPGSLISALIRQRMPRSRFVVVSEM